MWRQALHQTFLYSTLPYSLCKNFTPASIPLIYLQHWWSSFAGNFLLGYEHALDFPNEISNGPHQNTPTPYTSYHSISVFSIIRLKTKTKTCAYFITFLIFSPEVFYYVSTTPHTPPQKKKLHRNCFCFRFMLTIAVVLFWDYYALPLIDTWSLDFETVFTIDLCNNSSKILVYNHINNLTSWKCCIMLHWY